MNIKELLGGLEVTDILPLLQNKINHWQEVQKYKRQVTNPVNPLLFEDQQYISEAPPVPKENLERVYLLLLVLIVSNLIFTLLVIKNYQLTFLLHFIILLVYGSVGAKSWYISFSPLYVLNGPSAKLAGLLLMIAGALGVTLSLLFKFL